MSHQRIKRKPRCTGCGLLVVDCVCAQLPRVRFRTPIAIVQHVRELDKPTNTGKLFARMSEGTRVLPVGLQRVPFDPAPLREAKVDWRLVYPRKGAPALAPRPDVGYILLDGSWSQCAHMSRRLDYVSDLPCVALPPGPPSFWTVRTQPHEAGRSTFEAALQLLELHEGPEAILPLRRAFAMLTARMLFLKGKLPSPEVPASWRV